MSVERSESARIAGSVEQHREARRGGLIRSGSPWEAAVREGSSHRVGIKQRKGRKHIEGTKHREGQRHTEGNKHRL